MRIAATAIAIIAGGLAACKAPLAGSRLAGDDGLPGNIRAALGSTSNGAADEYDLQVSALSTAQSVVVCSAQVPPASCRVGAVGYRAASRENTVGNLSIYSLDRTINPLLEPALVVVARDANGQVLESQRIRLTSRSAVGGVTDPYNGYTGYNNGYTGYNNGNSNGYNNGYSNGYGAGGTGQTTNGTGGQRGNFTGSYGSGQFMASVPQDNGPGRAHGLLVLLHGSQASSYDRFVDEMSGVAQQYGLIPVSVLAPNGQGWNEGDERQAADYLDGLITQKLYREYNIDPTKIFFSGQSSGGGFLASTFIPLKANNYQGGGAFLQCGMMEPQTAFTPSATTQRSFKLHFEITSDDNGWMQYFGAAVQAYRAAGLTVTEDSSKTGGHCSFDQAQVIAQYLPSMLQR